MLYESASTLPAWTLVAIESDGRHQAWARFYRISLESLLNRVATMSLYAHVRRLYDLAVLLSRSVFPYGIRFQVPADRTAQGCNRNELIFLELEAHPEARFGFARRPRLLGEFIVSAIQYEAELHLHVTANALDRLIHRHYPHLLFPLPAPELTCKRQL